MDRTLERKYFLSWGGLAWRGTSYLLHKYFSETFGSVDSSDEAFIVHKWQQLKEELGKLLPVYDRSNLGLLDEIEDNIRTLKSDSEEVAIYVKTSLLRPFALFSKVFYPNGNFNAVEGQEIGKDGTDQGKIAQRLGEVCSEDYWNTPDIKDGQVIFPNRHLSSNSVEAVMEEMQYYIYEYARGISEHLYHRGYRLKTYQDECGIYLLNIQEDGTYKPPKPKGKAGRHPEAVDVADIHKQAMIEVFNVLHDARKSDKDTGTKEAVHIMAAALKLKWIKNLPGHAAAERLLGQKFNRQTYTNYKDGITKFGDLKEYISALVRYTKNIQ